MQADVEDVSTRSVVTATGIAMFGLVGILIASPGLVLAARRRIRTPACDASPERVNVAIPTRRA